jgi:integrase
MNKAKFITGDQSKQLVYYLDSRFKILFELAVESGLRISDLLALRVKDIKNPMTIYETKSKRKRTFVISEKLLRNLQFLCDYGKNGDYVFQSARGRTKHVHRSTIHRQIKKALKWLDFDASAHSARKLYANTIYKATGSVESVQKALNHQKLSTTLAYLEIPQQDITEIEKNATQKQKNIFQKFAGFILKLFKRSEP